MKGDGAMETVSVEQGVHNTAHRANIHSTPYGHEHEAERTTGASTDGTHRTGASAGAADTMEEGQRKSARTEVEAPAGRTPGSKVAFSARSRENSREEVFENNKTVKTDEERSGWWGALKKRFYRDMG